MALHQNEAKATKAIKEAKAHCGAAIREAEAHHTTVIREVEDNCTTIAAEAEAHCTTNIRKASHCMEKICSIQQLHAEDMQHLETDTIEEEERDLLSFLATCGVALQACPLEACGVLMSPLQLLTGNILLATLLNIPPRCTSPGKNPLP